MPDEGKKPYGTPAEQLQILNDAIYKILMGGQSYKIGSRSLTRADLSMLKTLRDDLEAQLAADESGPLLGRTYMAFFEGR